MIQFDHSTSNILVVDDTPENLTVLTQILSDQGYQVRPAINGQVALKTIQNTPPDLILLDILMPGIDGFEVCQRLKAYEPTRDIPVIFLSALDATEEKVRAFEIGGVDYITKPFQVEEVVTRIRTHLALRSIQKNLADNNAHLQEALANVKTLSGLLPICASCKKIRDDRGYWNQLERYIESHSDALFSHGLCPECLEKLYLEANLSKKPEQPFVLTLPVQPAPEKSSILVVDDTPENLTLLTQILAEQGYQIRPAINGQVALKAIQKDPPDLVLLDIRLPDMDGYAVCRWMKAHDATRDIPVIFLSALDQTIDKVKAFEIGGVDYITKPFQPEEVLARVGTQLTLQKVQKRLQAQNMQLHRELHDRKQAEEALQQQNCELAILNRMSHALQACHTEQETYPVVSDACKDLAPASSGYILAVDEPYAMFTSVALWGNPPVFQAMPLDDVQRMCRQTIDVPEYPEHKVYIGYSADDGALYIPVASAGDILAVLVFSLSQTTSAGYSCDEWQRFIASKQIVLTSIVEHYGLSLMNLRLRETLRLESIHDPLTGLFNRRHMEAALEREVHRMKRRNNSLGIIMVDIDHFKNFNDTYGHEAGDTVLRELGLLLQHIFRREDIACRYGGEEFLLILPETTADIARQRAEELLAQVRALRVTYRDQHLQITISAGVAVFSERDANIQETIRAADAALYQAKQNGRNQVAMSNEQ